MTTSTPSATAAIPRAVIFDFGRVLSMHPDVDAHTALVTTAGVPDEVFEEHYWAHRHAYDAGTLNGQTYWQNVAQGAGFELTSERLAAFHYHDALMWANLNSSMLEWAFALQKAGVKTAILSNMGDVNLAYMREHFDWLSGFTYLTWSCELLTAKPDPAIYQHTLENLGRRRAGGHLRRRHPGQHRRRPRARYRRHSVHLRRTATPRSRSPRPRRQVASTGSHLAPPSEDQHVNLPHIRAIERMKSRMPKRAVEQRQIEDMVMHAARLAIAQASLAKLLGCSRGLVLLQIMQSQDLLEMCHIALVGVCRHIRLKVRERRQRSPMIEGVDPIRHRDQHMSFRL